MSIFHNDLLGQLRTWAEAGMPDTCTITRPGTGSTTWDTEGNPTEPAATTVYSGKCLVQPATTGEQVETVGADPQTVADYHAMIPHDAAQPQVDDTLTVDTSGDADLVGRALRVLDVDFSSVQHARLLTLEDTQGG